MDKIKIVYNKGRNHTYGPEVVCIVKALGLHWGMTLEEMIVLRNLLTEKIDATHRSASPTEAT